MNKSTEKLIKLVTKHASENDAPAKAKGLIAQGADITAPTNYGSMLDVVNTQTKCLKQLSSPAAQNCEHVAHLLQRAACERLARQVLSNDGVDIRELQTLVRLEANCQQYEMYGPLGLLGALLNQVQVPVRLDVVRFLIENDPNRVRTLTVTDGQGKTCIHIAKLSSKSPTEVADYLQRQFDSILNQIPSSNPPTDENLIRTWIRLGANPEAVDENGNTVLSNAASKNNLALVRLLVSIGSDLTHKNRQGLTPLDLAERAEPTNPPLIKFLKAQNVNGQFRELILKRGRALTIGDVHSMLDQGLNINCPMPNNDSLLHLLIIHQAPPELVITFVNDLNADLSAANLKGHRAIEACILVDKDPCPYLKLLMKSPKMTSDKFKNATSEKTILQFAIENTRSHAASLIQEELNSRLWDMMMRANTDEAHNKSIIAACDGLIACGAQINHLHTDNEHDQWTVLHLACKLSTVSVVTHLVGQTKADFALRNGNSDSPLSTAAQYGYLPIVRYLHGLSKTGLHIANKDKETPLHLATRQQHLPVIRYLVRWGADHQALNRSKYTALDIAHQIAPRNKEEEMRHKEIIQFLTQLVCPPADQRSSTASASKKPSPDLDVCDLAPSVTVNVITMTTNDAEARRGEKSKEFLGLTPNEDLYEAAKRGAVERARRALKNGADIRYRKDGRSLYEIACIAANEYNAKSKSSKPFSVHAQRDQSLASNCQQIAQLITQIAQSKIVEAIGQSSAGLVVAYHAAGASLTADLLDKACTAADNVEIVDYLLANSTDINRAMLEMIATKSPYHIAKQRQFSQVAAYIKYRLSLECTNAIKANNLVLVRNLVRAGASVDTTTSNSLNDAIQLQNTELIQFLCENGALMPREWLSLDSIILDTTAPKHWKPSTLQMINRYLIDRRLRFAAAGGNYADLMKCLHLGANIDSLNCHGSSALLCALQHGDYFQIVHALVSRGASVLHSNESQPISFINLATENNYKRIADYLAREINTQFRSAVLNDDWKGAERFTRSGANVSCQDEQQRTPLHYAVQYHGVDWVRWLCTRGSDPNICDMNGDYPIHQAVEKGNYAVVELFVDQYPGSKTQKNKGGFTALQIAKRLNFNKIANLIERGERAAPDAPPEKKSDSIYDENFLVESVRCSRVDVIRKFIDQLYESKDEKIRICKKMIAAAELGNHYEMLKLLKDHYAVLNTELNSRQTPGGGGGDISLDKRFKQILLGFLGSLNNMITGSAIVLDPADPNTYTKYFSGLMLNAERRAEELVSVKDLDELRQLVEQSRAEAKEQLRTIEAALNDLDEKLIDLEDQLRDVNEQLANEKGANASERKKLIKTKDQLEKLLATHQCTKSLTEKKQTVATNCHQAIEFFKSDSNLIYFYKIVEERLKSLFIRYYSEQGGYVKGPISVVSKMIPIMNIYEGFIKPVLRPLLFKIDPKTQKQEWDNLSNAGGLLELDRIASETAGLLTLYYSEQIKSIDISRKIKSCSIFNDKLHWLPIIDSAHNLNSESMAVRIVADYVTAWLIDGLKVGSEILTSQPLQLQLWLHVARQDPADVKKVSETTNIISSSAGQHKIYIKTTNFSGLEALKKIQLCQLIGYVSVVSHDFNVYQYPASGIIVDQMPINLDDFRCVYLAPFSADDTVLRAIREGRNMQLMKQTTKDEMVHRFQDVVKIAPMLIGFNTQQDAQVLLAANLATEVAEILLKGNKFVDAKAVHEILNAWQKNFENEVDILREDMAERVRYFQTSIEAATERIADEAQKSRDEMKKYNDLRYAEAVTQLQQLMQEMTQALDNASMKRMKEIEQQLIAERKEISAIAEVARAQSVETLAIARQAAEASKQAIADASTAKLVAQNCLQSIKEQQEQFQETIRRCENDHKQTLAAQKNEYSEIIRAQSTRAESELERLRQELDKSTKDVKQSTRDAHASAGIAKDTKQAMDALIEKHKEEIRRAMKEIERMRKQNDESAQSAGEAQEQARKAEKRAADALEMVKKVVRRTEQ